MISDSFLRSYSISRIVKINEENKNRAKVLILRNIDKISKGKKNQSSSEYQSKSKQKSPKKAQFFEVNSNLDKVDQVQKNRATPENCLNLNNGSDLEVNGLNQVRKGLSPLSGNYSLFHDRKQLFRHKKNYSQVFPVSNKNKEAVELKQTNLQFGIKDSEINQKKQGILTSSVNSISRAQMAASNSKKKIFEHFYKKSLQNCSIEEFNQLSLIQKKLLLRNGHKENQDPFELKNLNTKSSEMLTAGWRNEVLQKRCPNFNHFIDNNIIDRQPAQKQIDSCIRHSEGGSPQKIADLHRKRLYRHKSELFEDDTDIHRLQIEQKTIYCWKDKQFKRQLQAGLEHIRKPKPKVSKTEFMRSKGLKVKASTIKQIRTSQ